VNQDSLVCILTRLHIGRPDFDSQHRDEIYFYTIACRPVLKSTQPPTHWEPGGFSTGVKVSGRESDHSPPSSAEVKKSGAVHLHGMALNELRTGTNSSAAARLLAWRRDS
jgi:hypothetical protein